MHDSFTGVARARARAPCADMEGRAARREEWLRLAERRGNNMWRSWYEIRASLNSIRIPRGDPGTKLLTVLQGVSTPPRSSTPHSTARESPAAKESKS